MTHNEPWVVAWIGHASGEHAPGRTSEADAIAAAHHLLLSHGWAVEALRRSAPDAEVGIVAQPRARRPALGCAGGPRGGARDGRDGQPLVPRSDSFAAPIRPTCSSATRRRVLDGDLEAIAAPIDFLGVNNYFRFVVEASSNGGGPQQVHDPGCERTDMAGRSIPKGSINCSPASRATTSRRRSTSPRTERPSATSAPTTARVHDPERTAYIESHIDAVGAQRPTARR